MLYLSWFGLGVVIVGSFMVGFIICALFASNSYDRGWRDCERAYRKKVPEW